MLPNEIIKKCKKCGGADRFPSGGCRQCNKIYRANNKEKIQERDRKYHEKNKERFAVKRKEWKEKNLDHVKELVRNENQKRKVYKKEWLSKNKDKQVLYNTRYRLKNPIPSRLYASKRRAEKRTSGNLSKDIVSKLFILQKGKCACCGESLGDKYHLDHIMPLALGGEHKDYNMQLLTASCNLKKSAKHPIDYMQSKGYLL